MLVDSHAHIDAPDFDEDRDRVLEKAAAAGVEAVLCPLEISGQAGLDKSLGLIRTHQNVFAAAGVHPHHASRFGKEHRNLITQLAEEGSIHAVGEIGLDFHYSYSPPDIQKKVFGEQLKLARELDLPVIVHSRKSGQEIIRIVQETRFSAGGVLHCFSEDETTARLMLDKGFYVSFSGILTYPSAQNIRNTAMKIPLEKLLVETDSPYLPPVPYRGKIKRNEPAFVVETAQVLAGLKNIPFEELAVLTTENFKNLFAIEIKRSR